MSKFNIAIIIISIFALILVFLLCFFIISHKRNKKERTLLYNKLEEAFLLMNNLFEKIETETDSFNSMAEGIFNEIDEKHDELVTVYNLINTQAKSIKENINEQPVNQPTKELPKEPPNKPSIDKTGIKKIEIINYDQIEEENWKLNLLTGEIININHSQDLKFSYKHPNKQAEEIYELIDMGKSVEEVSKSLSIGIGEIQLLLNLRG